RKRTVIALRLIMTLAVASQALSDLSNIPTLTLAVLGIYASTSIVLLFEAPAAFLQRIPEMLLFIFDISVVVALMLLSGATRSQFFVVFFLIILMAALVRSARVTLSLALLSAIAYAFAVGVNHPQQLLELGFPARIALFFVTAVFAGYMAEEVHRTQGQQRRF